MISVHIDGANMLAGAAVALAATGQIHWSLGVFGALLPFSFEVPGWPYLRIIYKTGTGWSVKKGRYK